MKPLPETLEPPIPRDDTGAVRAVGVEIELTGLDVDEIAQVVADVLGGHIERDTDYLARVRTEIGEFRIEADLRLLQRIGRSRAAEPEPGVIGTLRDAVAAIAERIAPFEIVAPPLPYLALPLLDDLAAALGERGGQGTDASLLAAFGLQLNPRVPSLTATSIHRHLRAYAVLEPWLRMRRSVNVARRVTPFIDPYPPAYVEVLLRQEEPPHLSDLIDGYLDFNPTRNRSLDLLPLFSYLDRARIAAAVPDARIKSRPTFHYRLPDSRVGEPGWRITDEWRHWLVVERLAVQPDLFELASWAYLHTARTRSSILRLEEAWGPLCEQLLAATGFGTSGYFANLTLRSM